MLGQHAIRRLDAGVIHWPTRMVFYSPVLRQVPCSAMNEMVARDAILRRVFIPAVDRLHCPRHHFSEGNIHAH
jgi:hypothetical protein